VFAFKPNLKLKKILSNEGIGLYLHKVFFMLYYMAYTGTGTKGVGRKISRGTSGKKRDQKLTPLT